MDFRKAFAPDVTLRKFFLEVVPEIHAFRGHEYSDYSDIDLIFGVHLVDTDERYTIKVCAGGIEVEDDEMIDFPAVTLIGDSKYWDDIKRHAAELAIIVDDRRKELSHGFRVTRRFFKDFEKQDAAIRVKVTGASDKFETIDLLFVLNNYEDADFPRFETEMSLKLIEAVSRGDVSVVEAAKSLRIRGDVKLAVELGGMVMTHADA